MVPPHRGALLAEAGLQATLAEHVRSDVAVLDVSTCGRRDAALPGEPEERRPTRVVGGDHAALTDRQVGGGVEAEAGGARGAAGLALEPATDAGSDVLDHGARRHPGGLGERCHLGLVTRPVHDHQGAHGTGAGGLAGVLDRREPGVRGHVEQHRPQAGPENGLHHRARRERGQGDPGTARKSKGAQGELDGGGSRGDGHRLRRRRCRWRTLARTPRPRFRCSASRRPAPGWSAPW